MVEIIKIGETGVTRHIDTLANHIKENQDQIVSVARVRDSEENYSYIAIFKDRCTVGKYSALIQEWGTNDGKSGSGGSGFLRMNDFLEANNIKTFEMELSHEDNQKIGYTGGVLSKWNETVKIWEAYVNRLMRLSERI